MAKEITIQDQLVGKTCSEKAEIKAESISQLDLVGDYSELGLDISILSVSKIERGIEVLAKASKNGEPVGFGKDGSVEIERFKFYNPPILVPDGTKRTVTELGKEVEIDNFKEDPEKAVRQILAETIRIVGKSSGKMVSGKRGNTVSTFYPDPNTESTSVDGYSYVLSAVSWADAHDALIGTAAADSDASTIWVLAGKDSLGNWFIWRSFFLFDTSSITDTDTIDSAVFSVYAIAVADNADNDGNDFLGVVTSSPATDTAIITADFDQVGSTEQHDTGERKDISGLSFSAYTDFTFNATGRGNVSKTGISKFALREGHDLLNDAVVVDNNRDNRVSGYYADQSGTTNDPKLVVTHTAGGSSVKTKNGLAVASVKTYNGLAIASTKTVNGLA